MIFSAPCWRGCFQFRLRSIFVVVTAISMLLAWWAYEPYRLAHKLRNSDVDWDGGLFGLMEIVRGSTAHALIDNGRRSTPALVQALDDPQKFAAAHVLLTKLWQDSYPVSAAEWNHLRVTLHASGACQTYPQQIPEIQAYWAEELSQLRCTQ